MQKLAELNYIISKSITLDITYNLSIENYRYNNKWVTDIQPNYFSKRLKKIEKLLDKNINYDENNHIKFLKIIHQDVTIAYEKLTKFNHEDYLSFDYSEHDWEVEIVAPELAPSKDVLILELPNPGNQFDDRAEYIIENIKGFFDINFDDSLNQKELNDLLTNNYNIEVNELNSIYAKAHLSYIISLHIQMVKEIAYKIDSLLSVIKKLEDYSEMNKTDIEEIDNNTSETKLEFAMSKKDIAIFFHSLHELNIIKTDTDNIHNSQTKLKSFIDNSYIYYKHNNNLTRVGNIKKQFTDLNNKDINADEIEFLKNLIDKFETRLEEVKSRES
jgi:cob(I)alamin adenosyltransferase